MRPAVREEEVICPRCKRYVGTLERCPYCRARVPKRLSFRLLKWGALAVAVFGILFLYVDLHGPHIIVKEPPLITDFSNNSISPTMNMASVYIKGEATFVKYYDDTKFLGMYVTDNGGNEIFVRVYDTETRRLFEMENQRIAEGSTQPKFPAVGDNVTIRGQLRVRASGEEGFKMMILQYAEGMTVERPAATMVTIENMNKNKESFGNYQRLEIGWDENNPVKIISIWDAGWATMLTLYEMSTSAETTLVIPNSLTLVSEATTIKIGDTIRAKGAFSLYYTSPQLWLAAWEDLEVL